MDSKVYLNLEEIKVNSFVCNNRASIISSLLASIVHRNKNILKMINVANDDHFSCVKIFNPFIGIWGYVCIDKTFWN